MALLREIIENTYPTLDEMPFCSALRDGRFGQEEILRSEIVELYRALKTRDKIQGIYKSKLRAAMESGAVNEMDVMNVEEIIDDEGETDDHIDHLDMRFKLFEGTVVSRKTPLRINSELEAINKEWMEVCEESDLYALIAVTAAIEDWYAPLSKFFEEEYRKRGFVEDKLEIFTVHKDTDVQHSSAQFEILEAKIDFIDTESTLSLLRRAFQTSRGYDAIKLKFAETDCSLQGLLQ